MSSKQSNDASLQIHDSLRGDKRPFVPMEKGKVRMYVCGITVYDYCHLGHARMLVVFDMIYRYLKNRGYSVTYVRNITDIDDKIIKRAQENGEHFTALAERFVRAMNEDTAALNILRPDHEPKATENIEAILHMIETLIDKGHAYRASGGDVYYSVGSFHEYGKLSGKQRDTLLAGARVEVDEDKRDPLDFVLWKAAKPGEPSWESPWGVGRPGWHIECSAMSTRLLGPHFDIHGGGLDLQFPHHENEIAQSEACFGEPFANYWIHNGFVRVNEEKMSKSLDNFFTIRDVLKHYQPEEVRFFILNSHYRSPLNYSDEQLDKARASLTRLYTALRDLPRADSGNAGDEFRQRFMQAMDDDFNTAVAVSELFAIAHEINRLRTTDAGAASKLGALLRELGGILGVLQADPEAYLQAVAPASDDSSLAAEQVEQLVAQRLQARQARNWTESDRIRDLLKAQGIILEDGPKGTTWRRG
ncbi:MAG TPA: cysteine--tRNA ligase [Gammaproteobacteria bacterium]|nr:cysteine--tRNA ligase [Gammaproteobacteria bacterium]